MSYGIARFGYDLSLRESRTTATLVVVVVGLWVLVLQARPFVWWKTLLVVAMILSVAVIMVVPGLRDFYALQFPTAEVIVAAAVIAAASVVLLEVGWRFSRVVGRKWAKSGADTEPDPDPDSDADPDAARASRAV